MRMSSLIGFESAAVLSENVGYVVDQRVGEEVSVEREVELRMSMEVVWWKSRREYSLSIRRDVVVVVILWW